MKAFKPKTLDELYAKYSWKTYSKFKNLANRYGFNDEAEIKAFHNNIVGHDIRKTNAKRMMLPIYSQTPNAYNMDTLIQSKGNPFLIFININSRKAYAYPMKNKGAKEVLRNLIRFKNEVKTINAITSDQDTAYLSKEVLTFMKNNKIDFRTTDDENHNILGILNRFIRTLRDLNDERDFTEDKMNELIHEYNNSTHNATNKSPNEFTSEDETDYVINKIADSVMIKESIDFKEGDRVRISLTKNMLGKNRTNYSTEAYIIDSKDGNHFIIKAKDGSTDRMPAYRMVKCSNNYKLADSIKGGKRGIIEKILAYDEKTDKYKVAYDEGTEDIIPAKNLREGEPSKLSPMERIFWSNKKNIPKKIRMWY